MGYFVKLPIFAFVLACLWYIGLFCYFNQTTIRVEFPYLGVFNIASAIVFLVSFLSGAIFSAFFFAYDALRKSFSLRRSEKKLEKLQQEVLDHNTREPMVGTESIDPDAAV